MRFVVRRVVVLGIARGRLNIRFGHCTSCLFDNSSVKLWKHDTPLLFALQGANYEQGLGQARPNKKLSQKGKNFQELKICGHGTILALTKTHTF